MRVPSEVVSRPTGASQPTMWWNRRVEDSPVDEESEWTQEIADDKLFGDERTEKAEDHIRIGIGNIGCWPAEGTVEHEDFKQWALGGDFDALMLNELGKNCTAVQDDKKIDSIIRGWWMQTYTNKEWLKEPKTEKQQNESQYGGAAIISTDRLASTVCKTGGDDEDLGRWAWTTFRGSSNTFSTVISLYHPCANKGAINSVEAQQLEKLCDKYAGEDHNVFQRYRQDLKRLLQSKLDMGHQLVLAGDFNHNLRTMRDPLSKMLQSMGLREVILERHGSENAPNTQRRGSHPIDGVWATAGIQISRGGYDTWNIFSDHRTLWVEMHESYFLGRHLQLPTRPKARRLQVKNPTIRNKFNSLVDAKMESIGLEFDTMALEAAVEAGTNPRFDQNLAAEYDRILHEREKIYRYAEKRCRKIRGGGVAYSPKIAAAMGEVTLWKMILKRHNRIGMKGRPRIKLIRQVAKKWKFNHDWRHLSQAEVSIKLKTAKSEWKRLKPRAQELRVGYLEELAEALAADTGGDAKNHFKILLHREKQRESWKRIKRAQGKNRTGLCSQVEIELPDGTRTLVTTEKELIEEIVKANVAKLQQANNTPLRQQPFRSYFGEDGDFDKWESIFQGKLPIPTAWDIERGTRLVLDKLSNGPGEDMDFLWTPQEYLDSWKHMREHTVSAPVNHFGHFQAPDPDSAAANVNSIMAKIPAMTGYTPQQWRQCVNSMIIKKINDIRAAKLRLITLLEAQMNHTGRRAGRMMMEYGEKKEKLAPEQYGSRKNKSSRVHALNKRLVLDIAYQLKRVMVLIANDAKSCYDRIILMVAYLVMRDYGLPKEVATCLIDCMLRMEHQVRTVYGDSKKKYGGDSWDRPPHGNGQGNTTGPPLWACISTILLDIMRENGFGMEFISVLSLATLFLVGFSFVDDTDLIQDGKSAADAIFKAQAGLDLWEEVIRATGGALEPSKSDWVLVDYKWTQGKCYYTFNKYLKI